MKMTVVLLVIAALIACEKQRPGPEILVGGPYLGEQLLAQPGPFQQQRAKERTSIPRHEILNFNLLLRDMYDRTLKIQIVNATGTVCHEVVEKITDPAYKTNPAGYGGRGIPLPDRASTCKEGAFPNEGFVPGSYTAKFWINDKLVTERAFTVEP